MGASIRQYAAAGNAIAREFLFVSEQVNLAIRKGAAGKQDLTYLATQLRALREKVRQVRASFDEVDILDFRGAEDPLREIALWDFEKTYRRRLADMSAALDDAALLAEDLSNGVTQKVIQARDTDTIQSMAAQELGDWQRWWELQQANRDTLPIDGSSVAGITVSVPTAGSADAKTPSTSTVAGARVR